MTPIKARYYDGRTSAQQDVLISAVPPDWLRVFGEGIDFTLPLTQVRLSARVGNTRRHLYFPDGSQCETADNDGVDALFSAARAGTPGRLLHRLESRVGYVVAALVLTGVLSWLAVAYGIPAAAKQIAFRLPAATEQALGKEALAGLDNVLFAPSRLPAARQQHVQALFAGVIAGIDGAGGYHLQLRSGRKVGANALALPAGVIVMTDELVALAQNDAELVAVFAHEIGHLRGRHMLRSVLQNSAMTVLMIAVTGDLSSVASLAPVLPALLLQSRYSRDFEREADAYATDYLKQRSIPPDAFAAILTRIDKQANGQRGIASYLSSHPSIEERTKRPQK